MTESLGVLIRMAIVNRAHGWDAVFEKEDIAPQSSVNSLLNFNEFQVLLDSFLFLRTHFKAIVK